MVVGLLTGYNNIRRTDKIGFLLDNKKLTNAKQKLNHNDISNVHSRIYI